MASVLKDIQQSVMKYANIISKVLKVEVEISDSKLFRIAGTGIYKNKINRNMSNEGNVYRAALETGVPKIIYSPGKDKLCIKCSKKNICEEKFEACTPIKLGGKSIGVIGLVCTSIEQKNHLLSDFDTYMSFLEQIAEFISITAYENIDKKRNHQIVKTLNSVMDNIDDGIIVLSKNNKVTQINKKAIKLLRFVDSSYIHEVEIKQLSNNKEEINNYKVIIGNQKFYFKGNICDINDDKNGFSKMFIFNEVSNINLENNKKEEIDKKIYADDILGNCDSMRNLKSNIKKIALSTSTVLILGESGTGKELFARAIHNEGNRKEEPFIAINCAAIPDALLESELFGYAKGAFTGANTSGKIGKFELANKGTIFLDEIGDMPIHLQTKILRVIQEKKIIKVGSNTEINIDVRVIAATNKNLLSLIESGKFREDLYYRLNVIPFYIPPLRSRIQDIEVLIEYFINKFTKELNKNFSSVNINKEVLEVFYEYDWPGNIRELENCVEYMINMLGPSGILTINMIPQVILEKRRRKKEKQNTILTIKELERMEIIKALKIYGNSTQSKKVIAKKLGIGIATLYRKIEEYDLSK